MHRLPRGLRLAPAAALALAAAAARGRAAAAEDASPPPRTRYLRKAEAMLRQRVAAATAGGPEAAYAAAQLDAVLCNRVGEMWPAYVREVRDPLAAPPPPPPPHVPLAKQLRQQAGGGPLRLRLAQWNLNVLHGYDMAHPLSAAEAARELLALNADVLCLQEAAQQTFPRAGPGAGNVAGTLWDGVPDSGARIEALHAALRGAGYALYVASGAAAPHAHNPALLATRLPVRVAGATFAVDDGERLARMLAARTPEQRSGRVVLMELALATGGKVEAGDGAGCYPAPLLAAVATHLHHDGCGMRGLRAAEARAVAARAEAEGGPEAALLVASDLNSVRRRDYLPREWDVLRETALRLGGAEEDGVAQALERAGFHCTYDAAPGGAAPIFTHWTSTTVDFAYLRPPTSKWRWSVAGVYVVPTTSSDHLPVVHDFDVERVAK